MEAKFPGLFTKEQLKGTLENYKNDKDQAIAQLNYRKCKCSLVFLTQAQKLNIFVCDFSGNGENWKREQESIGQRVSLAAAFTSLD